MGMFDTVHVLPNEFGLPEGAYQTKDLNCGLTDYQIDAKGVLTVRHDGGDYALTDDLQVIKRGEYNAGGELGDPDGLNIYGNYGPGSEWVEYDLTIRKNVIVEVRHRGGDVHVVMDGKRVDS